MESLQLSPFVDKAMEFNAAYDDLMRSISVYQEIEIDVSKEEARANSIKHECDMAAFTAIKVSDVEQIYQLGIDNLKEVSDDLHKHEIYYTSYKDAEKIQGEIDRANLNSETLRAFSGATITLLKQINSSDSRYYKSEEKVVNAVYGTAYSMIKMELLASGKSTVLDWVRADKVASSYINTLIEANAEGLSQDSVLYEDITGMLKKVRGSKVNYSYLDEGLILYLAMQEEQNLEKIEGLLMQALNEVFTAESEENRQQSSNEIIQNKIDELTSIIKKSRIYKNIILSLGLIALVISIKEGSEAIAQKIGHNEYRTRIDWYSSQNAEVPEYPEYMKPIKNYTKTTLTAYGVWNRENVLYGDYRRDIVEYDLSTVDLDKLENFGMIDFSELSKSGSDTETREEIDPSELYAEAIVEITRIMQDKNDIVFVPHEESQRTFLLVASTIDAILMSVGGFFIASNAFKKLKESMGSRKVRKEELARLAEGLDKYKVLAEQSDDFRSRFIQSYKKFEHIIKNSELKDGYERIRSKNRRRKEIIT